MSSQRYLLVLSTFIQRSWNAVIRSERCPARSCNWIAEENTNEGMFVVFSFGCHYLSISVEEYIETTHSTNTHTHTCFQILCSWLPYFCHGQSV